MQIRSNRSVIDTRGKVLVGALVLHRLEIDQETKILGRLAYWLKAELQKSLTRDLFDDLLSRRQTRTSSIMSGRAAMGVPILIQYKVAIKIGRANVMGMVARDPLGPLSRSSAALWQTRPRDCGNRAWDNDAFGSSHRGRPTEPN